MNTSISWMNVFEFGGGVRGEGVLDDRDDGFADGAAKVGVADVRAVMNESMEDRVEERDDFRGGLLSSAGPSCFKPGFDVVCLAPVAMNDQVFLMRAITGRLQMITLRGFKMSMRKSEGREKDAGGTVGLASNPP
jgi:hypothetical protein